MFINVVPQISQIEGNDSRTVFHPVRGSLPSAFAIMGCTIGFGEGESSLSVDSGLAAGPSVSSAVTGA